MLCYPLRQFADKGTCIRSFTPLQHIVYQRMHLLPVMNSAAISRASWFSTFLKISRSCPPLLFITLRNRLPDLFQQKGQRDCQHRAGQTQHRLPEQKRQQLHGK